MTTMTAIFLAGCGGGGSSPTAPQKAPETIVETPDEPAAETPEEAPETPVEEPGQELIPAEPVVITPNVGQMQTLTVYALSKTEAPVNGWITKKYTATGYCMVYQTKTYCWDDGIKIIDFTSNGFRYGPFKYTFWGLGNTGPCYGGCVSDRLLEPTEMTREILDNTTGQTGVDLVFSTGTARTIDCEETRTRLNCGTFGLDF